MNVDWQRSRIQEWPRYLESLSLFWIDACFAAGRNEDGQCDVAALMSGTAPTAELTAISK